MRRLPWSTTDGVSFPRGCARARILALYGPALSSEGGECHGSLPYLDIKISAIYLDVKILAIKIFLFIVMAAPVPAIQDLLARRCVWMAAIRAAMTRLGTMKSRDSAKSSPAKRGRGTAEGGGGGGRAASDPRARYHAAAGRVVDAADHVDRALAGWAREMPDVEIRGADVLNRARRVVLESRAAIEENFKAHGLDTGEFDVLAALRRAGEPYALRPTELYRSLMISSGGLTARLDRLEAAGLIRRRAADDDARSVIVELTRDGRKKIEAAFRAGTDIENRMVSGLSESERAELVRLLRKLTQAMRGGE